MAANLKKNDLVGAGVSVLAHALLLIALALLSTAAGPTQTLGYIEVEFGPVAAGRPVAKAVVDRPDKPVEKPVEKPPAERPAGTPKKAKPVELPKQNIKDPERVKTSDAPKVSPKSENTPSETIRPEPPSPAPSAGGGSATGSGTSTGESGSGADEKKSAPFQIEGLNRSALSSPLPYYAEKVNATVRIRITVDPLGRVVQRVPVLKGSPALDQAAMDALARWRFNPLPANAPQETQTGIVTFHFRLQ